MTRPSPRIALLLPVLVLASAAAALEQPAETPKPHKYEIAEQKFPPLAWVVKRPAKPYPVYGIYTWFGEYRQLREQVKQVGWKTLRIGGPYTDENMKMLFDEGLNFVLIIPGKGKRDAFDTDEEYIEAKLAGCNEFLDRFGEGGSFYKKHPAYADRHVPFMMIHNEPNFHYMWKAGTEAQREALYAKMAPKVMELIRRRSPKTRIIGFTAGGAGAGDMRFVKHVCQIDPRALTMADAVSTHPYVHPAPPEANKVEKWGSYSMANSLNVLRDTFASHGVKDMTVWYTEGGWPISKADGGAYDATESTVPPLFQAAYSVRYYAMALRLGVSCVTNMFITDTDGHAGGFFDRLRGMAWRPSARAVQTMVRVMPHPKLIGAQADGEDQTFIYEFKSNAPEADSPAVIMAYRIEGPRTVEVKLPCREALVTDMLGETTVMAVDNGTLRVEIGPYPIYIQDAAGAKGAETPASDERFVCTDPPSMTVTVTGGPMRTASGETIRLEEKTLRFEPVTVRAHTLSGKKVRIPANHEAWMDNWGPGWASGRAPGGVRTLKPPVDTLMLGSLYRQVIVDSVVVKSADGGAAYQAGVDYKVNPVTGQVVNIDSRLGKPDSGALTIDYKYACQRIDLIQADAKGRLSVKTGEDAVVCPQLPGPDRNCVAIAGVYVSPHPVAAGEPGRILREHIYPIVPHQPVQPINPEAVSGTISKLESGEKVAVAFLGDSITLGAEAGPWWEDRSKTYTGRVTAALKRRYPKAEIREIAAYQGGITTTKGTEFFNTKVKPQKPDLLLIALGANDAGGSQAKARHTPAEFKEAMRAMVVAATEAGTEVMLVTPLVPHACPPADRIGPYRDVLVELAAEQNVACADVQTAWKNLAKRGVRPYSQLHNCSNHPGEFGMTVYSETILRFFGDQ